MRHGCPLLVSLLLLQESNPAFRRTVEQRLPHRARSCGGLWPRSRRGERRDAQVHLGRDGRLARAPGSHAQLSSAVRDRDGSNIGRPCINPVPVCFLEDLSLGRSPHIGPASRRNAARESRRGFARPPVTSDFQPCAVPIRQTVVLQSLRKPNPAGHAQVRAGSGGASCPARRSSWPESRSSPRISGLKAISSSTAFPRRTVWPTRGSCAP